MPLSTYIDQENVKFNGELTNVVPLQVELVESEPIRTLIPTDGLNLSESDRLAAFLDSVAVAGPSVSTYGFAGTAAASTGLNTPSRTNPLLKINFKSGLTVTGATPTGFDTTLMTAAYQEYKFSSAISGAGATGLANSATTYTATIVVDSKSYVVTVTGSAAQTYTTLIAVLAPQLPTAVVSIEGGNLRVTANSKGVKTSSVTLGAGTLFASLTNYTGIGQPVGGTGSNTYHMLFTFNNASSKMTFTGDQAPTVTNFVALINTFLSSNSLGAATLQSDHILITPDAADSVRKVSVDGGNTLMAFDPYGTMEELPYIPVASYKISFNIDGVVKSGTLAGTAVATYTAMISAINGILGASATAAQSGNAITVTSATTGATSTVRIIDASMFSAVVGYTGEVITKQGADTTLEAFDASPLANLYPRIVVGPRPRTPANPPRAELPKVPPYLYWGGSPAEWRWLADDSQVSG